MVWQAMEALPHGFDPTDRLLLLHGSLLADAYDVWFQHWSTAQNVRLPRAHAHLCRRSNAGLLNAASVFTHLMMLHLLRQCLQGTELAKRLAADDVAGKVAANLKNHYTVIVPGEAAGPLQLALHAESCS